MNSMKVSAVVPVYNEGESLKELNQKLTDILSAQGVWEIIYVDDGSTDGSSEVLHDLSSKFTNIKVVSFVRNRGKSDALSAGFSESSGDVIVTLDADLQDDPSEIQKLLNKLDDGFDMVVGWRSERKDGLLKRIPSVLFNKLASLVSKTRLHDINCGLKAMKREVAVGIRLHGELHRYMPVLAEWRGYSVSEVSVNHNPRVHGKSKYGLMRLPKGLLDLITVKFLMQYSKRPLHFFGGIGFTLLLAGVVADLRVLYLKYVVGDSLATHISLLLLGIVLIIVGVQFISLGLLGELFVSERK